MCIVDLDNFKSINDSYGHRIGDEVLHTIAGDLCRAVGEDGVVGRYGGDEFMIVYFGCTDYDGVHAFLSTFYKEGGVFRRNLSLHGLSLFSTATIGCAVYPTDADSFDGLFALVDKTLYRGKSKGRNCFIIYVPAKHAHLEIPTLAHRSLYDAFYRMAEGFDGDGDMREKLRRAFQPMMEYLRMHRLFLIDADNQLQEISGDGEPIRVESPAALIRNGLHAANDLEELRSQCPTIAEKLQNAGFESVLISPVVRAGRSCGFLLFCPEAHTLHLWQENECAAAFFLSHMLAHYLEETENRNSIE